MKARLLAACCSSLLLACSPTLAATFDESHDRVQAAQPGDVSMELRLPKSRFHQGEIIPATVVIRRTSKAPYQYWMGTEVEGQRLPDLAFHAAAENGEGVPDPVRHPYPEQPDFKKGGKFVDLEQQEITVPANRWLRFEHPGTYHLYAWSRRVVPATAERLKAAAGADPHPLELVSKVVTVQIEPLAPALEKEILAQAAQDLASGGEEKRRQAMHRLRFLQTPSAREMLMPLLGERDNDEAGLALSEAADPEAGRGHLLEAVGSHRVPISMAMIESLRFSYSPSKDEKNAPLTATKAALIEAAKAGQRDRPWDAISRQNVLTLFLDERIDGRWYGSVFFQFEEPGRPRTPEYRTTLVERQLELNDAQGEELLRDVPEEERPLFLPLIRQLANAPSDSLQALPLLAKLAPAEARQLVLHDILHPPLRFIRHYRHNEHFEQVDLGPLLCLPTGTVMPELNDALRYRLSHLDPDWSGENGLETALKLAAHYGSRALLPLVLREYRQYEGRWACSLQESALVLWLRADPPAGVAALKRALAARKATGCYRMTLDLLHRQWTDEALPLVLSSLDDEDEGICCTAARLLAEHAVAPFPVEKLVETAERLSKPPYFKTAAEQKETGIYSHVQSLLMPALENEKWQFTRAQLERLRAVTEEKSSARASIDARLAAAK